MVLSELLEALSACTGSQAASLLSAGLSSSPARDSFNQCVKGSFISGVRLQPPLESWPLGG